MKKVILIMGLISLITSCCSKIFPKKDDFLTIPRTQYNGDELRIDGYFYQKWENGTKYSNIVFLYNNGIVFNKSGYGDIEEMNEYVSSTYQMDFAKYKGFWGLFLIKDKNIIYERWEGTESGYLVYREEGNIVNDTTFIMTEVSRMKQGVKTEIRPIEWTYHFKAFSPKPDSTNSFIP
ncbi:hypothetical protein [Bacteroides heparinolyticus]|uniref:hypothetical protein n=1 Tax=Prevotella heparinolytica TaxID=28113 RepID=UPI0035A07AA6